jgi:hypothetical protein
MVLLGVSFCFVGIHVLVGMHPGMYASVVAVRTEEVTFPFCSKQKKWPVGLSFHKGSCFRTCNQEM